MLISKMVQIEFANTSKNAVDAIPDIRKAAESAGINLLSRHDVQLQMPMVVNDRVVVEIKVPKGIAGSFAIGNHLRGIATYLLKSCNGRYDNYVVGKRLLTYTEIPNPEVKTEGFPMVDRLEAIANFAKLLERSDEEALDQICRIITILKEGSVSCKKKGYCYLTAAVGAPDGVFEPEGYSSKNETITVSGKVYPYIDPDVDRDSDVPCHELYDDLIEFYDTKKMKTSHTQSLKKIEKEWDGRKSLNLEDEFENRMSSDYIGPSRTWANEWGMSDKEIGEMLLNARTIGGHMIWPVHSIPTINTARAGKKGFYDRIDLTLYEIRNMMMENPQTKNDSVRRVIKSETKWFNRFCNGEKGLWGFQNFIDNFRLNPFVFGDDYQVISLAESDLECGICIPVTMEEDIKPDDYRRYVKNNLFCIKQREE